MKVRTMICVSDVMTANVVCVKQNDLLHDALRLLEFEHISALPVVDHNEILCGIVSTSDLIRITDTLQSEMAALPLVSQSVLQSLTQAFARDQSEIKIASVMTESVTTVRPSTRLVDAARSLIENEIHHLPVVDQLGKAIGMISTVDIVRAVAYNIED